MKKILATTVVHKAKPGKRHGGAYLVDFDNQGIRRVIDCKNKNIDWSGDEGERGLRGIAQADDALYLAHGNALVEYDLQFHELRRFRCPWLLNPHGISLYRRQLYIVSTGNDCVLAFDLDRQRFVWAMHVVSENDRFKAVTFDPQGNDGPLAINKLQLRTVDADDAGLRFCGLESGGLLYFNGKTVTMSVQLPPGSQDAVLFREGALFNDSRAGAVRYVDREHPAADRAMMLPFFTTEDHALTDEDSERALRRGYGRGLLGFAKNFAVGGFTPAGLALYDIGQAERLASVSITNDVNEAINCLAFLPG